MRVASAGPGFQELLATSASALELCPPALEKEPLGVRVYEVERAVVGRAGVVDSVEPAQQLCAGRVEIVVAVELEALDQGERGLDLAGFGDGDGPVQLDDRRAGEAGELAVQRRDLRPVLDLVHV